MRRAAVAASNASITTLGNRVVITGGTQGIGAGIAQRFAKAGAEVWIAGRNETKANDVLTKLYEISEQQKINPIPKHHFIKADFSQVSEMKRVANDIRARAGSEGVDYLVMCQGGPPNGTYVLTSEGNEEHFAVQVLSRFILAYMLGIEGTPVVKIGVMSVMGPGKVWLPVDIDDLELVKAKKQGTYGFRVAEFAQRNPNVNFTHLHPGAVITDFARNSSAPWYLYLLSTLALALVGSTPESYAEVPFYLLANPEGRAAAANVPFWDHNIRQVEPHPLAQEKGNRTKVWDHFVAKL